MLLILMSKKTKENSIDLNKQNTPKHGSLSLSLLCNWKEMKNPDDCTVFESSHITRSRPIHLGLTLQRNLPACFITLHLYVCICQFQYSSGNTLWNKLAGVQISLAIGQRTCCWITRQPLLPSLTLKVEKSCMTIALRPHHVLFLLPTYAALPLTDGVKQRG